jgi:hypothetical protein
MRVAIIVLIVVGVAYALFFVMANNGSLRMESIKPPSDNNGKPDASWTPPSFASTLSNCCASFGPHADLGLTPLKVGPNQTVSRDAASSGKKFETATIQLNGPGGLDIRYSGTCASGGDCSQALCLCIPGSPLMPARYSTCLSHLSSLGGKAGACTKDAKGTLVIYPNGRTVTFTNMGYAAVSADLK